MPEPRLLSTMLTLSRDQLYGRKWRRARGQHLVDEPLCRMCKAQGKLTAATTVDHIIPHRGNPTLFWDRKNWQSLCSTHHNSNKQAEEKTGKLSGIDSSGRPTHPSHPWNVAKMQQGGGS